VRVCESCYTTVKSELSSDKISQRILHLSGEEYKEASEAPTTPTIGKMSTLSGTVKFNLPTDNKPHMFAVYPPHLTPTYTATSSYLPFGILCGSDCNS
jgi:hypothetical protein